MAMRLDGSSTIGTLEIIRITKLSRSSSAQVCEICRQGLPDKAQKHEKEEYQKDPGKQMPPGQNV